MSDGPRHLRHLHGFAERTTPRHRLAAAASTLQLAHRLAATDVAADREPAVPLEHSLRDPDVAIVGTDRFAVRLAFDTAVATSGRGATTIVIGSDERATARAREWLVAAARRTAGEGWASRERCAAALDQIVCTTDPAELRDAELVVIGRDPMAATRLHPDWRRLATSLRDDSIVVADADASVLPSILTVVPDPSRVVVQRSWFSAADHGRPVVEVAPYDGSSPAVADWLVHHHRSLGRRVVRIAARPGLVIEPILAAALRAARALALEEVATLQQIAAIACTDLGCDRGRVRPLERRGTARALARRAGHGCDEARARDAKPTARSTPAEPPRIEARHRVADTLRNAYAAAAVRTVETGVADAHELGTALSELLGLRPGSPLAFRSLDDLLRREVAALVRSVADGCVAAATGSPSSDPLPRRAATEARDPLLDRLQIAWQPIVAASSRETVAFEALSRFPSDVPGTVEEIWREIAASGRQLAVGRAVRQAIAGQLDRLPEHAQVFVNVHPAELCDELLLDPVGTLGAPASRFVLEITEQESILRVKDWERHIGQLRRLGYRIALDDFGAGHNGLVVLASLPADFVKLDRELLIAAAVHDRARKTLSTLSGLCGDLGCSVVGEGIESAEQEQLAVRAGCALLQGYRFGRPAPLPPQLTTAV